MNIGLHGFPPKLAKDLRKQIRTLGNTHLPTGIMTDTVVEIFPTSVQDRRDNPAPYIAVFSDDKADFEECDKILRKIVSLPSRVVVQYDILHKCAILTLPEGAD